MFTGIVETVGRIVEVVPRRGSTGFGIASSLPLDELRDGDSVAVDGACLTVCGRREDRFLVEAVAETLDRSTLSETRTGRLVHLERALRLGDRVGGHLIQGHIDATAPVLSVVREGGDHRVRIALISEIRRYIAPKGSVALAGVSLTVAGVKPDCFEVVLIPHTLAVTTLGGLRAGDRLNVEADLVARYLERLAERRSDPADGTGNEGAPLRRDHV